jgi:hypothetical protein
MFSLFKMLMIILIISLSDLERSQTPTHSASATPTIPDSPIISIDVSSNQIASLDHLMCGDRDFLMCLATLKKLDLSNNRLIGLPEQFFEVTKVRNR